MNRFRVCLSLSLLLTIAACRTAAVPESTCDAPRRVTLNVSASGDITAPAPVTMEAGECVEFSLADAAGGTGYTVQRIEFERRPDSSSFRRSLDRPRGCDGRRSGSCSATMRLGPGTVAYRVVARDPAGRIINTLGQIIVNCYPPRCMEPDPPIRVAFPRR